MIFKCAGCEGFFSLYEHDRLLGIIKTDLTKPVEDNGICPICALATIKSMELDAALHGVQIVNGRANEQR